MTGPIGIRREDKNRWEARVPLTPADVKRLREEEGIETVIQPSEIRVHSDEAYRAAGARVEEDLGPCRLILAVKEIPARLLEPDKTYVFFSHTIKGQAYNMPLLRRLMELRCNLIDYETVTDGEGRRLIFFGRHAGVAGMIDTLWALGRRLEHEGAAPNPFAAAEQAFRYADTEDAKARLAAGVGAAIEAQGLPEELVPMVFGFAGYGNVSQGAQEVLDVLPVETVDPDEVPGLFEPGRASRRRIYKTVFEERHLVKPKEPGAVFELQDYYDHPEKYGPAFYERLRLLTVLMNCIFWTEKYPRLATKEEAARLFASPAPRLRVVGDISCDVEGSVEFLLKTTDSGNPVYVYEPDSGRIRDGVAGRGPVVLAVDNLPCEIPRDSSEHFSRLLRPFVPALAAADFQRPFEDLALPDPIHRALILHRGRLTPRFAFMNDFIA